MNNDFIEIRGLCLPRRMVLQGLASLLGCTVAPNALSAAVQSCALTTSDIVGPFYRFGAPFQTKLAGENEPGERLIISGKIYGSDRHVARSVRISRTARSHLLHSKVAVAICPTR